MMKKGFGKGFCSGILVAALTVGLGVSAMAASRTITVDDNIRITLNGAVFSPKDARAGMSPCSLITAPPTPPSAPSVRPPA